jgi:C4-dicarboxylate transporter DctM subunit
MSWTLFALPALALLGGLPIFVVLLLGVLATVAFHTTLPGTLLQQTLFSSMSSFSLLAIPFFLFAGELMGRGGISSRILDWVLALAGRAPGAVGMVAVGTSGVYGAISGSSPATVASIAPALYPQMRQAGYGGPFSLGLINAAAAVSIVLPPSINLILYGAAAEQSIVELFTAGILPGILMLGTLALAVIVYSARRGIRGETPFSWSRLATATRRAVWALLMPVFILGTIYGGIATPTESAGAACVYAAIVTVYIHRELSWRQVLQIAGRSAVLTGQIMIIVAAAGVYSWLLTTSGIQAELAAFVAEMQLAPWMVLLAINILLLVVGCFLDPTSAVLTLAPLLLPIVEPLGVHPVHFGVLMTMNLSIGMFTPPFGLNLFVTQACLKVGTAEIYKGVIPFAALQILALLLVTFVPWFSLALLK